MYQICLKSLLDIFCEISLLILFLPKLLMLVFCLFISGGNLILFKQERMGGNLKPFVMYSFIMMKESKAGGSII